MTGIEIAAVLLFLVSFAGAFASFMPLPKNEKLLKPWKVFVDAKVSIGLFLLGMVLLYAWG